MMYGFHATFLHPLFLIILEPGTGYDGRASHTGGIKIFLVTSSYKRRVNVWPDEKNYLKSRLNLLRKRNQYTPCLKSSQFSL